MNKFLAGLALVAAALLMTGIAGGGKSAASAEVRLVYIVPSDKQELPRMEEGARNALLDLQRWYRDQLGNGMTFAVSDKPMLVVHSSHPEAWFREHPPRSVSDRQDYVYFNAVEETPFAASFSRDLFVVLVDADTEGRGHEASASGRFAVMPWRFARSFAGQNIEPPCRATGVLGHELGHLFGLKHPAGCVHASGYASEAHVCWQMMYWGGHHYPATSLSEQDKGALRMNPLIAKIELPPVPAGASCDRLLH